MNPESIPIITTAEIIGLLTLGIILVTSAYTELKDNRIPNFIPLIGVTVGLLVGYFPGGPTVGQSAVGFLVGFGFFFLFYMFGGMGGGDVKLMGAIGALVGYPMVLPVLMFTSLIGGVMAVALLIWNKRVMRDLVRRLNPAQKSAEEGSDADPSEDEDEPTSIPYGLAIIAGCALTFFLST